MSDPIDHCGWVHTTQEDFMPDVTEAMARLQQEAEDTLEGPVLVGKSDLLAVLTAMRALEPRAASDDVVERDEIVWAWSAGALAVHDEWAKASEEDRVYMTRDEHPDFTEAAYDYAAALQSQPPRNEARLREALEKARHFLTSTNQESGWCCCGDTIASHGVGSGHSPTDEQQYYANDIVEQIDAALSNEGNG